jgi:hypothetical protein
MKHRGTLPYISFVNLPSGSCSLPCESSDERDEFVQLRRRYPREERAEDDCSSSEKVLLPFDSGVVLARSDEEAILHDPHCWEELKGDREEDSNRV